MALTDLVQIPEGINAGVSSAKQATMLAVLGNPRESYDRECRPVTNPQLAALMVFEKVGNLKVRGLGPAVEALGAVLEDIREAEPVIYRALGHAGMLCARNVRGSATAISNHSWGTAIDLTLEGVLDRRGDGLVQQGLTRIFQIFNHHGYFWGAAFRTEDAMHFECSDELIRRWHDEGKLGARVPRQGPAVISLGDRGLEVRAVQEALNRHGASLVLDGDFGRATMGAVMEFQAQEGLMVDGVVGARTKTALGLA